jgi:hypothetical protein
MSRNTTLLTRSVAIAVAAAASVALGAGSAQAAPACENPVATVVHEVHEATGDPTGTLHEAEEVTCSVG